MWSLLPPLPIVKDIIITSDFALGVRSQDVPGRIGHWSDVDDAFAIYRMMLEQIKGRVNVLAVVVHPSNALNVTQMYGKLETLIEKTLPKSRSCFMGRKRGQDLLADGPICPVGEIV